MVKPSEKHLQIVEHRHKENGNEQSQLQTTTELHLIKSK